VQGVRAGSVTATLVDTHESLTSPGSCQPYAALHSLSGASPSLYH